MKRMPTFSLIGAFLVAVLLVAVVTVGMFSGVLGGGSTSTSAQ